MKICYIKAFKSTTLGTWTLNPMSALEKLLKLLLDIYLDLKVLLMNILSTLK